MAKTNQKQHYIARFYLRNFAEPLFSDKLQFFDLKKEAMGGTHSRGCRMV
jgi:hypothetical protein